MEEDLARWDNSTGPWDERTPDAIVGAQLGTGQDDTIDFDLGIDIKAGAGKGSDGLEERGDTTTTRSPPEVSAPKAEG